MCSSNNIAAYGSALHHAFAYVRGEVVPVLRRLHNAVAEAHAAGFPRPQHRRFRIRSGAGGTRRRGSRLSCARRPCSDSAGAASRAAAPLLPAVAGLYGCPTVINVETIASVPSIILGGIDWFRSMGSEIAWLHSVFAARPLPPAPASTRRR